MLKLLFPTMVYRKTHPQGDLINSMLAAESLRLQKDHPECHGADWARHCGVWQSGSAYKNILQIPFWRQSLQAFVEGALQEYVEYMGMDTGTCVIALDEAWVNINGPGTYQEFHNHVPFQISGCYYISVPEGSGEFHLRHPNPAARFPFGELDEMGELATFQPKEGELIVFPSGIDHRVTQNASKGERISLAFNASVA